MRYGVHRSQLDDDPATAETELDSGQGTCAGNGGVALTSPASNHVPSDPTTRRLLPGNTTLAT